MAFHNTQAGSRPPETREYVVTTITIPQLTSKDIADRAGRGYQLYLTHRALITHAGGDTYTVPSCTGSDQLRYTVHYGGTTENCTCTDFAVHRGEISCKHLLAVGIMHASRRALPRRSGIREVRIPVAIAGDPIAYAGKRKGCPVCFGGYVTVTVEEDGQERDEAVPCRRCLL